MIALNRLTDEELLRHARNESDTLVTTTLEAELVARFGTLLDGPSEDLLADHCGWADEALAQFPEEDFLQEVIDELSYLGMQRSSLKAEIATAKKKAHRNPIDRIPCRGIRSRTTEQHHRLN